MTRRSPDAWPAPAGGAFVVWLDEPTPGVPPRGSVEHTASAERLRFEDLSELPDLIRALCNTSDPER